MNFLKSIGLERRRLPKNLIGFDFVNFNNNHKYEELMNFNNLKDELSEKIFFLNEIKLKQLTKASKIINEYCSLEREIWGGK